MENITAPEATPSAGQDPLQPLADAGGTTPDALKGMAQYDDKMGLTADQVRQMTEWAVEDGKLTREQADAALKGQGIEPPPQPSESEKHLTEMGYTPAKATEFNNLPPLLADRDASVEDIGKAHSQVTGWMTTAKLSREDGNALAYWAADFIPKWSAMPEIDQKVHHQVTLDKLQHKWGGEFDGRVDRVKQLCTEIDKKSPGFLDFLADSGVGNDFSFIVTLSNHAERLYSRHAT
jgi:hypothetical protein